MAQANAARAQAAAQFTSAQRKVAQSEAMVTRSHDVLSQYDATAPLDGVVTNLPVRVGETVVPGIQNSTASTIMTIADMSMITAEVNVDETDIVNVKLDQSADVTIDAIPNKTFKGNVIEIGDTAMLRSTGVAASQSQTSSQEAKDFKVVIALDIPERSSSRTFLHRQDNHRHPLACSGYSDPGAHGSSERATANRPSRQEAGHPWIPPRKRRPKEELQGVFVVSDGKAEFHEVKPGLPAPPISKCSAVSKKATRS